MAWTTPKTWTADTLLTASDLNQYVSDNLSALYALTQGGGRKNLLHNGAMQVAQRGTPSTATGTSLPTTADRWAIYGDVASATASLSVESDAPTGSGFRKSLKWLQTNAGTVGTSGLQVVAQRIEGQNLQSIKKGTTSAEQLTLSFWVKSNKTGVYTVELQDVDNTRHVAATYTVVASATWEQKTITFPADLTGAFDNDNALSLSLNFNLAAGTNFTSGTLATTWGTRINANVAPGQTNLAANTNNYWQVTGVQLEVGSAATGFEHKDYATELAECQRYYEVGTPIRATAYAIAGYGADAVLGFATTKRATPVVTQTNTYADNCSSTPAQTSVGVYGWVSYRAITTAPGQMQYTETWTASADI